MTRDTERLYEIVATIVKQHDNAERISPSSIATQAMTALGGTRLQRTNPLIYIGCHLQLRQIARGECSKLFDLDRDAEQHDLFPGLQRRYPVARIKPGDEPEYIKLELASAEDLAYNIDRLKAEGAAKIKHADRLIAYMVSHHPEPTPPLVPAL